MAEPLPGHRPGGAGTPAELGLSGHWGRAEVRHRSAAGSPTGDPTEADPRARRYGPGFRITLKVGWEASDHLSSQRLQPFLLDPARILGRNGQLIRSPETMTSRSCGEARKRLSLLRSRRWESGPEDTRSAPRGVAQAGLRARRRRTVGGLHTVEVPL